MALCLNKILLKITVDGIAKNYSIKNIFPEKMFSPILSTCLLYLAQDASHQQTFKMDTAHGRVTRLYTRALTFLNDGHCTYVSLISKHQKMLIEQDTKLIVEISKKELETIIDGKISSIRIIKIPNNSLSAKELEHRVVIEYLDDVVTFSMGPSNEQMVSLHEELMYARIVRGSNETPKAGPNTKHKPKRRPQAKDEPEELPATNAAEEVKENE